MKRTLICCYILWTLAGMSFVWADPSCLGDCRGKTVAPLVITILVEGAPSDTVPFEIVATVRSGVSWDSASLEMQLGKGLKLVSGTLQWKGSLVADQVQKLRAMVVFEQGETSLVAVIGGISQNGGHRLFKATETTVTIPGTRAKSLVSPLKFSGRNLQKIREVQGVSP